MSVSDKRIEYGSDKAADKQKALRGSGSMGADFEEMAKNVYKHLNDEISKKVFEARMQYAKTGDLGYITSLESKYRNLSSDMQVYVEKIPKGSHCLIYGAGVAGHYRGAKSSKPQIVLFNPSKKYENHLVFKGAPITSHDTHSLATNPSPYDSPYPLSNKGSSRPSICLGELYQGDGRRPVKSAQPQRTSEMPLPSEPGR